MKPLFTILTALLLTAASHAGTFSTAAWTNDASSGIVAGQTSWAYHFGSATNATVNGVPVPGSATGAPLVVDGRFTLNGANLVFNGDTNNVTTGGSDIIANDFVYGGFPATITLLGLTAGQNYTASFLSVGWQPDGGDPAFRALTFASGGDSQSVQQSQFGNDNGIRIDYAFTADAATRVITVAVNNPNNATFHLYGLALRPVTFVVTNTNDTGPGSLRQTLADAAAIPGADTITFAPALSGGTITLASGEFTINHEVTLDATSLPAGLTVSGGFTSRIFSVNSGSLTLRGLTLTGGNALGAAQNGNGGAIVNFGTLTLMRCTLSGNAPANGSGGAILNDGGTLSLSQCTLSANTSVNGGAIFQTFGSTLTLTHCTLSGNSASVGVGGGIYNEGTLTLTNSIVAGNTAPNAPTSADIYLFGGTFTRVGANIIQLLFNDGGSATESGPAAINAAPQLAALASNGGPTQTMALQLGSPARNAAVGSTITSDQRGFPIVGQPDIGAYEAAAVIFTGIVANNADSGPGSLRQTLADAAAIPGADTITFAPALSGGTITLASGEFTINHEVTLDATSLPAGLTVSGGFTSRIFSVNSGSLTLRGLTLTGGNALGAAQNGNGGAIVNFGTLTLMRCTLSGNAPANGSGGAILNDGGTLSLSQCTLSANTSVNGGAIFQTFGSTLTLTHCTLSGNSASVGVGGGIYNEGTLTLTNSIVAGNTAPNAPTSADIYLFGGTFTRVGANIIQLLFNDGGSATESGPAAINAAPQLAALASNGGPTQTMALQLGSPARNAAVGSTITSDQRGFPIVGQPDIGAYEAAFDGIVANNADSGPGSLRQTLADAAANPGADTLTFAPGFTGPITLSSEIVLNDATGTVTIDAGGLTISGGGTTRIFSVSASSSLALSRVTLTGGSGTGATASGQGGAIYSDGSLVLDRCTLHSNTAVEGGAVRSVGSAIAATQSTFSGNTALIGGACSLAYGGPSATFTHCTLAGNTATGTIVGGPGNVGGGGLFLFNKAITLTGTLIAGNTSPHGPDVQQFNMLPVTSGVNFIGDLTGSGLTASATLLTTAQNGSINLAALASNGGPTQTRALLAGSPAINAAVGSTITSDQRGFPIMGTPDIGAYEAVILSTLVINTADSGAGSLRQALANAAANPGADTITFAPALSGGTITLTSGEFTINHDVTIDATSLPAGLTIDGGPGTNRIFSVSVGNTVSLHGLTLTGGNAVGAAQNGNGGAIVNFGTLTLTRCTLSGNAPANGSGGAILNDGGTLSLSQCTLSANTSVNGGAIFQTFGSTLTLTHCTLSGNTATGNIDANSGGGAIFNNLGTLTLTHCSLSGNSTSRDGGAISTVSGTLTLTNSIVAGNTAPTGADISLSGGGTFTRVGANIVQSLFNGFTTESGPAAINAAPQLAALASNGGPTQTMALQLGSPARNAAVVLAPAITSDQRGFPIVGQPDIGAYEAGAPASFTTAGIHQNLGGGWRTASVAKPLDIDADNVLGTDGYHVVNRPAVLPAYVGSTSILGSVFPGNGGYTQLDDPLNMPATFQSGTITSASGFGVAANLFQFTLNAQAAGRIIRVGLLVDNLDAEAFNSDSLQLVQTAPESASSAVVATTSAAFNDRVADWVFFDIAVGASGGTFAVRGVAGSNNEATVAGVAFDSATPLVTTTNNAGPGSLRQAVAYAALNPGADTITFTPALSGGTITLSSEIVLNDTGGVTLDAASLPAGMTISGGGTVGIFTVGGGSSLTLLDLTLSNGRNAITNSSGGTLALTRCTLSGNSGVNGGAIFNSGTATVTHCTFSSNSSTNTAGAIANTGSFATLTLTQCTLTGNSNTGLGGGALNNTSNAIATLTHCTIAGNQVTIGAGGGIRRVTGTLNIANCIIAANTAPTDPNVSGTIVPTGNNLTTGDPQLAPLDNYGGPTKTRALLPLSPARNAAVGSTITSDQRGFPIVGIRDIGAYEAGTLGTNYNAYIWETLPASATPAQHAAAFDFDKDGQTNGDEFNYLTSAANAASFFQPASFVNAAGLHITFPSAIGRTYRLRQSDNLATWSDAPNATIPGDGSVKTFTVPQSVARRFFQILPQVP